MHEDSVQSVRIISRLWGVLGLSKGIRQGACDVHCANFTFLEHNTLVHLVFLALFLSFFLFCPTLEHSRWARWCCGRIFNFLIGCGSCRRELQEGRPTVSVLSLLLNLELTWKSSVVTEEISTKLTLYADDTVLCLLGGRGVRYRLG